MGFFESFGVLSKTEIRMPVIYGFSLFVAALTYQLDRRIRLYVAGVFGSILVLLGLSAVLKLGFEKAVYYASVFADADLVMVTGDASESYTTGITYYVSTLILVIFPFISKMVQRRIIYKRPSFFDPNKV